MRSINRLFSELRDQNSELIAIASREKNQRRKEQTENDLQTEINRLASQHEQASASLTTEFNEKPDRLTVDLLQSTMEVNKQTQLFAALW
jgi:oligoendopeptidase F